MSAWSLYCTVCNGHFERPEWLPHLLGEEHQEIARVEVTQEWNKKKVKKCVLVVFSSFPVGETEVILRFFEAGGNTLVTDFVWWRERSKMALVQFESKKKLNQVLSALSSHPNKEGAGSELWIDNQLVQFVKAVDMLELQWKALLPPSPEEYGGGENTTPRLPGNVLPHNYDNIDSLFSQHLCQLQRTLEEDADRVPFLKQVQEILKAVQIPDVEFGRAEELRRKIEQVIASRFPTCQVRMFRHWYLQLRNPDSPGRLLLSVYQQDERQGFNSLGKRSGFFRNAVGKRILPQVKTRSCLRDAVGRRYRDAESNLEFGMVTMPMFMIETQLCRLYKYLVTFHPLAYPLLGLVYYWTAVNQVNFGSRLLPNLSRVVNGFRTPPPAAMEWLVMFFLCREKLVPTPRTVLQRPHAPFTVFDASVDIGFSADLGYAQQWRSEGQGSTVVTDLIKLCIKFFRFCGELGKGPGAILNTRDAEIIPWEGSLEGEEGDFKGRLEEEEWLRMRRGLEKHGFQKSQRLYILNPLLVSRNLDVCEEESLYDDTLVWMRETGEKLEGILEGGQDSEGDCLLQALHIRKGQPGRGKRRQGAESKKRKLSE